MLLEDVSQAEEEVRSLDGGVVCGAEVHETHTVATEEAELLEVEGNANRHTEVETAEVALVTIPIGVGLNVNTSSFGSSLTGEGKSGNRTEHEAQFGIAAERETIVEQNGDIDDELFVDAGFGDTESSKTFLMIVEAELTTDREVDVASEAEIVVYATEEAIVMVIIRSCITRNGILRCGGFGSKAEIDTELSVCIECNENESYKS